MTDAGREHLVATLTLQVAACHALGSEFYAALLAHMISDVETGGRTWSFLGPYAEKPMDDAYALRVLGGVHRLVLNGEAPELATHYPSTAGDGDAAAAWPGFEALLAVPPPALQDAMTRPPQTNEVWRSVALVGGMLLVAAETGLPLRLRELGSSAGLNLRADRYWYEHRGHGWGEPTSPVRFVDLWAGDAPSLEAGAEIADRRGCDVDPMDATSRASALTLLSYVWPGQDERFARLRAALDLARDFPVVIDRVDAAEWLERELAEPTRGFATVVFHSVMWQYLPERTRAAVVARLAEAGARASREAPLAWLRLEPRARTYHPTELRLTRWPGGEERLLATAGFHSGPVDWTGQVTPPGW